LLPDDWPDVDGILSMAAYQEHPVTLDWSENRVVFESEDSLQARTEGLVPGKLHLQREVSGYGLSVFLEIDARPQPLRVLLDSGNVAGTVLAPHAFEMLGVTPPTQTDNAEEGPSSVALDIVVAGVPVSEPDVFVDDIIYDGNLGTAFLNRHAVTLDPRTAQVWVVPK
jgi:hypothetical protein